MNENNSVKSAIFGWVLLAGAYVLGKRHGREKCMGDVKDAMLKGFIEEKKKEEKGS